MRKVTIGIAAAAAMLITAAPALAQVDVRVGEPGVGVRIGPGHPDYRAEGRYRHHHGCKSVTIRERVNGHLVVRTRERCG